MKQSLDGKGKKVCVYCKHKSVASVTSGRCPFHWASNIWGIEWASSLYPEHPEAKKDHSKQTQQ